ncbi:ribosomal protein L21-like protein [Lipomyces orientalis]|uniref:Ribosomal protein L21-like protein n=1 Tax=Lipomyces orientalis TaxID=1233043 RepID=A0ACC3TQ44_9ASCO
MARPSIRCGYSTISRLLFSAERPTIVSCLPQWTRQVSTSVTPMPSATIPSVALPKFSQDIEVNETIPHPTTSDLLRAFPTSSHVNHAMVTPLYATTRIHKNSLLVTVGDVVTLPYRLKDVVVGDIIRLTQIETLGSRQFTWKGDPYIDERAVVKARVVEHTKEPMRMKIRTKRRNRRVKQIKSKHHYTVIVISEIGIDPAQEIQE